MKRILGALMIPLLTGVASAQERPPQGPSGTVTLSRTDYDRLLELSSRARPAPERAPLPAAVGRADIKVRVDGGMARGSMVLEGEVFHAGVVKVPLISGATILDARMASGPLPLVSENNTHVALIPGPSTFSATLEWAAPLTMTPGRGSFVLPVPPAGSVMATIDIPGERSDVRVLPGLVLSRTSQNGRTTIQATLNPGSPTQVVWSARDSVSPQAQRDVRMLADFKTLLTIGEADVRMLSLVDINVLQGEPARFQIRLPAGYEVLEATGASLDSTEEQAGTLALIVSNPAQRRHQFLITMERATTGGSFKLETGFATLPAAQRETGEIALAGIGTLEIGSAEIPNLRRVDVREVDRSLASAAGQSMLAAYRYQRVASGPPIVSVDVTRFSNAPVLPAVAERAVVTTLVTTEGRALTEVTLWLRNRAQPFMKVTLPAGASVVSSDVAGQPAKPVDGPDGTRIPLLRAGFRPAGPYVVSFVYLHAGAPFLKKGDMHMGLPRMELPVTIVEWEVFVPEMYRVDRFDGDMIAAEIAGVGTISNEERALIAPSAQQPGSIMGRIVDPTGAAIPGVSVIAQAADRRLAAITDADGRYTFDGIPSGPVTIVGQLAGFKTIRRSLVFDQRPQQVDLAMQVGQVSETVTVNAESVRADVQLQSKDAREHGQRSAQAVEPSANVQSLQRRAAGVLPVRIEVPRAGSSYRFVKPLVINEETAVSFRYRRR
jgi:carboxypeptidase family protein